MKQLLFNLFWWVIFTKVETKNCYCVGCCLYPSSFCIDYKPNCEPNIDKHYIYKKRKSWKNLK